MSSTALFRFVFAVYCIEAGLFFLTAPWLPAWERLAFGLPWGATRTLAMSGWVRGAVTGFGLAHFLWLVHDIAQYIRRRTDSASVAAATPTPGSSASETAGGR